MSFQFYTKTKDELVESAKIISDNFAELVGCNQNDKNWSPSTAYGICSAITMAGISCSNIPDQFIQVDDLSNLPYEFLSSANSEMRSIWSRVMEFDSSIYNMDKISDFKLSDKLSKLDKLKICIEQSTDYDSYLYQAMIIDEQFKYSEDFKRVAWIVLACFTIRYIIFDFAIGTETAIDVDVLNDSFLEKVKNNIKCEKQLLSSYKGTWSCYESSPDGISELLSKLLINVKQLQMYVLSYIK